MEKQKLIDINNLYKEFKSGEVVTKVLNGLSFRIAQGEFVAIMGPSGSGKSTLMNILGFLDRPTSGQYFWQDQETTKFDEIKLANLRNNEIGFIFQQFNLLPRTSVLDNVVLPLTYSSKISKTDKQNKAQKAIEQVDLGHRLQNLSNQLSGGEKQRVAIARALVNDPSLIFADEPTGNLDSKSGALVMSILAKLNKAGKTIILVTHEQYTAEYAERIIHLRDGLIESDEKVKNRHDDGLLK